MSILPVFVILPAAMALSAGVALLLGAGVGDLLGPAIGSVIGIILTVIGRFVWHNHVRSKGNTTRIDRVARTIFGDDDDDTRPGIAVQVRDLSEKVDRLEKRVNTIDEKVDRICEKLDV